MKKAEEIRLTIDEVIERVYRFVMKSFKFKFFYYGNYDTIFLEMEKSTGSSYSMDIHFNGVANVLENTKGHRFIFGQGFALNCGYLKGLVGNLLLIEVGEKEGRDIDSIVKKMKKTTVKKSSILIGYTNGYFAISADRKIVEDIECFDKYIIREAKYPQKGITMGFEGIIEEEALYSEDIVEFLAEAVEKLIQSL